MAREAEPQKSLPKRTFRDVLFRRNRPEKPAVKDSDMLEPGYYVRGGDWPASTGPTVTEAQFAEVAARMDKLDFKAVMAEMAATPVEDGEPDLIPEQADHALLRQFIEIYPQAMKDLADTPEDTE